MAALANLAFGDVLLLEAQVVVNGASLLGPIEAYDAEFDAIRLATALGIIVVEAGGNGTNNGQAPPLAMDTFVDPMGRQIFNPGSADFRDSGAIIVTAASSAAPHTRLVYGPHGQRIDCYAWGHNIETCASTPAGATTIYQGGFGGTSGASPIITGAALAVQGMAEASLGYRFSPLQMRVILSDPANGTEPSRWRRRRSASCPTCAPSSTAQSSISRPISTFAISSATAESRMPARSRPVPISSCCPIRSPTRRARSAPEAAPRTATRSASPQRPDRTSHLCPRAQSRRSRRGQRGSNGLLVARCEPRHARSLDAGRHRGAPQRADRRDSHGLARDHLAVGTNPGPGSLLFCRLDRTSARSGAVARRPSRLGQLPPLHPREQQRHLAELQRRGQRPFARSEYAERLCGAAVPGARRFDRARPFQLEVSARLPKGAKAFLEVPEAFARRLKLAREQFVSVEKSKVVRIPLPVPGRRTLPEVSFPAKSRTPMRLLVQIPEQWRKHAFEIAVRQIFEKEEVGRVTWRLVPKEKKKRG